MTVVVAGAVGLAAIASTASTEASSVTVTVRTNTVALTAGPGGATPATISCQPGSRVVGGGTEVFYGGAPNLPPFAYAVNGVLEPINGAEFRGSIPSDASANPWL